MTGNDTSDGRGATRSGVWATLQQVFNLLFAGVFGVVLARFVSVDDFGVYNYAITAASLGAAIMAGGLLGLAIREYHDHPASTALITGSILAIRELLALGTYILLVGVSVTSGGSAVVWATAVASMAVIARVFDAPELWFQSNLQAKTPALIRIATGAAFFSARICLLWLHPNVSLFIALFVAEQAVISIGMMVAYCRRRPRGARIAVKLPEVRRLAKLSFPLFLSSLASQLNLRVSLLILQALTGSFTVGLYSAATRISELLYTLPVVFMTATFPRLLKARSTDPENAYKRQVQRSLDGAFWLGVIVVIGTQFFGTTIVVLLFGPEYETAGAALRILVLASPFVFMAAVVSKWIVAEGLLWLSLGRHAAGACLSVLLSFTLIPSLGMIGAAMATVSSYAVSSYVFAFFARSSRPLAVQMTLAAAAPLRLLLARKGMTKE